jgi:hypothetical protein
MARKSHATVAAGSTAISVASTVAVSTAGSTVAAWATVAIIPIGESAGRTRPIVRYNAKEGHRTLDLMR